MDSLSAPQADSRAVAHLTLIQSCEPLPRTAMSVSVAYVKGMCYRGVSGPIGAGMQQPWEGCVCVCV